MNSLLVGDPKETISVPMIHSVEQKRKRDYLVPFSTGTVTQHVTARKMTREHYLKHYAKNLEGDYVGTEKPAVDAGLVFVLAKSSSEDILAQVRKVAFGREHDNDPYAAFYFPMAAAGAGAGMGF